MAETVSMTDGRLVEFSGGRRMQKSPYISADGSICVRLDFRNGQTRTLTLRQDMIEMYAAHGAERKLGDEIVGVKDITDALLAIDKLISRLDSGDWNKSRKA
jgi:hypothetical protein